MHVDTEMPQAFDVIVTQRRTEAEGIVSLRLARPAGQALPVFSPGSHIDLHLAEGLVRQYSLCSAWDDPEGYEIAVQRHPNSRGGSNHVHDHLVEGTRLTISAPRNNFPLLPATTAPLLVSGGIGITPILAMAEAMLRDGKAFRWHHCAATAARVPFANRLQDPGLMDMFELHLGDPGENGFDIATILSAVPAGTEVYVCGPVGMIDAVLAAAREAGLTAHRELFGAEVSTAGDSFEVVAARSGVSCLVPADMTVAEALARAGVEVPLSCEQGVCGTCITRVLEGLPDHRDSYLSEEERADNSEMALCCSRALSDRLILDI